MFFSDKICNFNIKINGIILIHITIMKNRNKILANDEFCCVSYILKVDVLSGTIKVIPINRYCTDFWHLWKQ